MRIYYFHLLLALVLLWMPLAVLLGRRRRRDLRNPARGVLVTVPALLACPWAWFDLVRASVGAWLLMQQAVEALAFDDPARWAVLGVQMAVLLVGVWVQIMGTGSRHVRLAPLFYMLGLTTALVPWQVALFGGLLGFALTGMLRRWNLVFWLMPLTLLAATALFRTVEPAAVIILVLFGLVALVGLQEHRRLSWIFAEPQGFALEEDQPRRHHRRRRVETGGRVSIPGHVQEEPNTESLPEGACTR